MASYLFVYGGKPVEHPLVAQLGGVVDQVWHGTWPLSLLIVAGPVDPSKREVAGEQARRWLVDAYSHYRAACTL